MLLLRPTDDGSCSSAKMKSPSHREKTPDKPIAKAPLSIAESVVMVEWAHGRNVARWRDQVRNLAEP